MNKIEKFKLGSDPELFLYRRETNEFFPPHGITKGTKESPEPMKGLDKGFLLQIDRLSLEYNIPPVDTEGEWVVNHMKALDYIKKIIPKELELSFKSSVYFDEKYMELEGAKIAGCDVDYNVYTQGPNPKPEITNFNTVAGHIHIGFNEPTVERVETLVKILDLFLGVPSVLIDEDRERRKLYGKAGCFRFTNFGLEFRTLSNFWLQNEELMAWVYQSVQRAIDFFNEDVKLNNECIQICIDTYDEDLAKDLINQYNIKLPETYFIKQTI